MLFLEAQAGWLLVVHAVVGMTVVATSTHLVVWLRRWPRGRYARVHATRRFAWLSLSAYALAFALGNLVYPTYKARVRVEYLDNPTAIARAAEQRAADARAMSEWTHGIAPDPAERDDAGRLARLARWFDVKEHWVLIGLFLALACAAVLQAWRPDRDGPGPMLLVMGSAIAAAAIAWSGAIIGLVVSAARAVG